MTTISKDNRVVTLINVFTVEPENQQKLADMLVEATEKTMKNLSGFVSATIHRAQTACELRITLSGVAVRILRRCSKTLKLPHT